MRFVDLVGQKFGKLTVIKRVPDFRKGVPRWECQCICGNKTFSDSSNLKKGVKSCGCDSIIDLTGQTFERLTVMRQMGRNSCGKIQWECQCSCGRTTICNGQSLRSGNTKSCGCIRSEERTRKNLVHNMKHSPEYSVWQGIIQRCTNKNEGAFKNYGGRGITIHPEWRISFSSFYNYIGKRPSLKHTIDRIDNNLGYVPGNVRWATRTEQNNNQRSNKPITFNGKTMNITQWAKELGINSKTIRYRIVYLGWPVEKALNTLVEPKD